MTEPEPQTEEEVLAAQRAAEKNYPRWEDGTQLDYEVPVKAVP